MAKRIYTFVLTFVAWVVVFVVEKPLFMLCYKDRLGDGANVGQWFEVVSHGLTLDISMAGYLTCVPALLLVAGVWAKSDVAKLLMRIYTIIASVVVSVVFVVNAGLYGYWGFPLDATPIFYFLSSPADAMASVTLPMAIGGLLAVVVSAALVSWALNWLALSSPFSGFGEEHAGKGRYATSLVLLALTAALIIPIRGGVTVSTANTGKVYFSDNAFLNHAAVNPVFSLMESLAHQKDFASQYRFMDAKEADAVFSSLVSSSSDNNKKVLRARTPDVYIVVMESFSMELWKTDAVPNLKSIARHGLFFTNMYANSFRTDRGLVAILSGFPAQPTMSIMKYPKKTAKLPSIASALAANGYGLKYYYGGDADFTNMRSYLVAQGFDDIISDVDFPVKDRLSKWGVPDGKVFGKLLADLRARQDSKPMLRVLQTSSSHEPFDVPYHRLADERLNAFAYTDSCVGNFVAELKKSGRWDNSLVILVPDHQGCWPRNIDNQDLRHYRIPMIWTGGAVAAPGEIDVAGSQQDIAATLLGQMGIDHGSLLFSKDLLCPSVPHFAFFTVNDIFGMVTEDNVLIHDNKSKRAVVDEGAAKGRNLVRGRAYLQKLYDYIAKL